MASRALKNAMAPPVKNSTIPKMGAYCKPDATPHIQNAIAIPGGNKASKAKPGNSVALKK